MGELGIGFWILGLVLTYGWVIQVVGLLCFLVFWFKKPGSLDRTRELPGVTIIKPCYGAGDNESENFDPLFNQDYPGSIQLLFSVSSERDLAIPVIQSFQKKYPRVDARIIISKTRRGSHLKVDALYDAQLEAKHECIIWSDADTITERSYASQMVAALQKPGVSVVTTPQFDARMDNAAVACKGLGNNADCATIMSIYHVFHKDKKVAWGNSLAFKKSEFEGLGPVEETWNKIFSYIVDDQAISTVFAEKKKRTEFFNIYCPVQWSGKTWQQVSTQKKYWAIYQRVGLGNRLVHLSGILLYPLIPALFLLVVSGFSSLAASLVLGVIATRILVSLVCEALMLRSIRITLKYFWTIPIWDIIQPYYFFYAFRAKTVRHSGKLYRISGKQLIPFEGSGASSSGLVPDVEKRRERDQSGNKARQLTHDS